MTTRPLADAWGSFRPKFLERALIDACRRVPRGWWGRRLVVLLRRLVKYGGETPLDVEVWGLRLRLHRRGNFSETELLFSPHCFDPAEREILRDRLRPGAVFLDIGANAGAYSFWVCSVLSGDCTVLAVEPDPDLYGRVSFNIGQNRCPGMTALNVAVGGRPGRATLTVNPAVRGQNSLLGIPGAAGTRTLEVEVRTLAQVVDERRYDRIDAMKVDIEGMEEMALGPFFEVVDPARWPRLLILEFKDTEEHRRLRSLLEGLGYTTLRRAGLNLILERAGGSEAPRGVATANVSTDG
jgi:FkbM family methyltransferase